MVEDVDWFVVVIVLIDVGVLMWIDGEIVVFGGFVI